jgi:hypothetical protein
VPSWWWISDASLSPPFTSRVSVWWAEGEDRFRRVLVKALGFSGPKRLPSTGAPRGAGLHRTPLWWEPATVLAALPPRAGFRRSFAAPRSRLEWLDPGRARELIARERPWPRAALSTSATDHDPRAQPLDRPNLAHRGRGRPRSQLFFARPSRVQRVSAGRPIGSTRIASGCASRHGQPRIHGPGAESSLRSNPAPPAAIAREQELRPNPIASSTSRRGP